jgi:hypothetical protein
LKNSKKRENYEEMAETIFNSEPFKNHARNLALAVKTYVNGIGKIEEGYRHYSINANMKNFVDFEELILKQSEIIYQGLCDQISNITSDIIAILAQSFVDDDRSFKFEADVLGAFNEESEMLQQIVDSKDAQAYSDQLKNLLNLTKMPSPVPSIESRQYPQNTQQGQMGNEDYPGQNETNVSPRSIKAQPLSSRNGAGGNSPDTQVSRFKSDQVPGGSQRFPYQNIYQGSVTEPALSRNNFDSNPVSVKPLMSVKPGVSVKPSNNGSVRPPANGSVRPPANGSVRPPANGSVRPASNNVSVRPQNNKQPEKPSQFKLASNHMIDEVPESNLSDSQDIPDLTDQDIEDMMNGKEFVPNQARKVPSRFGGYTPSTVPEIVVTPGSVRPVYKPGETKNNSKAPSAYGGGGNNKSVAPVSRRGDPAQSNMSNSVYNNPGIGGLGMDLVGPDPNQITAQPPQNNASRAPSVKPISTAPGPSNKSQAGNRPPQNPQNDNVSQRAGSKVPSNRGGSVRPPSRVDPEFMKSMKTSSPPSPMTEPIEYSQPKELNFDFTNNNPYENRSVRPSQSPQNMPQQQSKAPSVRPSQQPFNQGFPAPSQKPNNQSTRPLSTRGDPNQPQPLMQSNQNQNPQSRPQSRPHNMNNYAGSPVKITQTAILYPDGNFDFQQLPPQQMKNMYRNESAEKDYDDYNNENMYPNQNEINQNFYNPYMQLNQQAIGGPQGNVFRG